MTRKRTIFFFLIFFLLNNCSFDKVTGIWDGGEEEKRRLFELEKEQRRVLDVEKIYSSENIFNKEILLSKNINLSKPLKNSSWRISNLNNQNLTSNLYLTNTNNTFLKKKVGKNKHSLSYLKTPILIEGRNIIFSDDTGTIFNLDITGKVIWKKNVYKKIYKKINKNLVLVIYKNKIYIADNVGFIYSLDLDNGELLWIKNHAVPIKSNIKIFDDKIFLIDQDNKIISLSIRDGSTVWSILTISSFIKSQSLLTLAISKKKDLVILNSAADLYVIDSSNGDVFWSSNTLTTLEPDASDFFISSKIVIDNENIIFSAGPTTFSYDLIKGVTNWTNNVSTIGTPIIDKQNIFLVTDNGYFVIINKNNGEIISSNYILKILKDKKRNTKVTGFVMGSGKLYSVTLNGFLIVSSASTGKVESVKKIGDPITSPPIINDGKLFILTEDSKIIGFN
tara:strand:- start:46 stop:1395 length:1350 start_codon:yes stop_codon:yes gene_type:complete